MGELVGTFDREGVKDEYRDGVESELRVCEREGLPLTEGLPEVSGEGVI